MAKKYKSSLAEQTIFQHSAFVQHEEIKKNLTILPALESLIPPLNDEEKTQLEANLIKEGCREALLVWPTTESLIYPDTASIKPVYILIDGHNRYRICKKNNLDFPIHFVSYTTMDEAKSFMIDNQIGRRNLSPEQASYLRGMKYLNLRQTKGKYDRLDHKDQNDPYAKNDLSDHKDQNDPYGKNNLPDHKDHFDPYGLTNQKMTTAEQLAAEFNVGQATIKRDAEFAKGLEMLAPELKTAVLAGKSKVSKSVIQQLSKSATVDKLLTSVDEIDELLQPIAKAVLPSKTTNPADADALLLDITALVATLKKSSKRTKVCDKLIGLLTQLKEIDR